MVACEYKRCGGKGKRVTSDRARRAAQVVIAVDGYRYKVCESCADIMFRDLRQTGHDVCKVDGVSIDE